jgi:hypothetical protein
MYGLLIGGNVRDHKVGHDGLVGHAVSIDPAKCLVNGFSCNLVYFGKLCMRSLVIRCPFFPF